MYLHTLLLGCILMTSNLASANNTTGSDNSAYDYSFFTLIGHNPLPLAAYRGKVLLIVNVASKCGFTPQYASLEKLYEKYKDRGLVILGVPSNDFGSQEPGTNQEIVHFCQINYGVSFPMTAKEVVSGKNAHPFYIWAKQKLRFAGVSQRPEVRKKISEANRGEKNAMYGKKHTEETKQKIGEKNRENMKGKLWWNNGQIEKRGVECPGDGWERGRIKKH